MKNVLRTLKLFSPFVIPLAEGCLTRYYQQKVIIYNKLNVKIFENYIIIKCSCSMRIIINAKNRILKLSQINLQWGLMLEFKNKQNVFEIIVSLISLINFIW